HVEEGEVEKFRGWKIDVREQALRRRVLGFLIEAPEETLDAETSVPAHDARRNFVAEREEQDGRVIAELADAGDRLPADSPRERGVVEERDVLRPGEPDHDAQPVQGRLIEEIAAGRGVHANGVEAELRHEPEVR